MLCLATPNSIPQLMPGPPPYYSYRPMLVWSDSVFSLVSWGMPFLSAMQSIATLRGATMYIRASCGNYHRGILSGKEPQHTAAARSRAGGRAWTALNPMAGREREGERERERERQREKQASKREGERGRARERQAGRARVLAHPKSRSPCLQRGQRNQVEEGVEYGGKCRRRDLPARLDGDEDQTHEQTIGGKTCQQWRLKWMKTRSFKASARTSALRGRHRGCR